MRFDAVVPCWTEKVTPQRFAPMKLKTLQLIACFATKTVERGTSCGVELGRQQLTRADGGGAAYAAVHPRPTRLTAAVGGGAAVVSQQGLSVEHTTRAHPGGVPLCGIRTTGQKYKDH